MSTTVSREASASFTPAAPSGASHVASVTRLVCGVLIAATTLLVAARTATAQIPEEFTNLQVFSEDIERDKLIGTMRKFSFALGVRCEHCHYQDGDSFRDIDFASDENPTKEKARYMIEMLRTLNTELLPGLEDRRDPPVAITCKTCHRGRARPFLLSQEMLMATHSAGADSAVALYEQYREDLYGRGRFDFGEWETNTVAEDLAAAEKPDEAITIYELNAEYYPESVSIWSSLGSLYEQVGRTDDAIAAWERVLELQPNARQARERLDALRGE